MSQTETILVVDDEKTIRDFLSILLSEEGYQTITASDGQEALELVSAFSVSSILLDARMPGLDGFEVAHILKNNLETNSIPIIMVTALNDIPDRVKALESGVDDFLSKPVDRTELIATVKSQLKVKSYNDYMRNYQRDLECAVKKRTEELNQALALLQKSSLDTIYRLSRAAEYKDAETGKHLVRISQYCEVIARALGLGDDAATMFLYTAPMHDIGKIGIPEHILHKPGRLSSDEWEIMKTHTTIGAQILAGSTAESLKKAETIALTHHERWDGTGYPRGLSGQEIPLEGRITAVADVFDVLCSWRPYKEPIPVEKAMMAITEGKGSHFDPEIVDAFFSIKDEILCIIRHVQQQAVVSNHIGSWNSKEMQKIPGR